MAGDLLKKCLQYNKVSNLCLQMPRSVAQCPTNPKLRPVVSVLCMQKLQISALVIQVSIINSWNKRADPCNKSWYVVVRLSVVLRTTFRDESDWRFRHLSGSLLHSQVLCVMSSDGVKSQTLDRTGLGNQVVGTSVSSTTNSLSHGYSHADDHASQNYHVIPGFKLFTIYSYIFFRLFIPF